MHSLIPMLHGLIPMLQAVHTWNQMLLMGLLIQNIGSTQNPVKTYHRMVPSQDSTPDSEGSPIMPTYDGNDVPNSPL